MWDNGKSVNVEALRTFSLLFKTDYCLDLKETFEVPSFR